MQESREINTLSPYACKSAGTKGRKHPAEKCNYRTEFQKDRDRITHSKAFRRLMHKTQVFISPEGDHYRTRLTHTLEVAQIARTVARTLKLNEDLTEAISLGHDLGHTPFGHTGEDALNTYLPGGFEHNVQSVRVVEVLENGGRGLNLTAEVIDGILNHRTAGSPATLEGKVVQISDKIAYMNHDIDDALRAGLLRPEEIPEQVTKILGTTSSQRIDFLVKNMVTHSMGKDTVSLQPEVAQVLTELRTFLFENVYANQLHMKERKKIQSMIGLLFEHYTNHPEVLPPEIQQADKERAAADYIACMTDRFAQKRFTEIFMPASWSM
jgi:dGTPase